MARKVILYIATSIDGYIADKERSVKFLDKYNETGDDYGYNDFFSSIDVVIVGNTTQEQFPTDYGGKKCFVFSKDLKLAKGNISYVSGDVVEFMKTYNPQGNIWIVGGANLFNQFFEHNLVDELIITIIPETLGDGVPLFAKSEFAKNFELLETKALGPLAQLHFKAKP